MKQNLIGTVGVALGLMALALSVFHFWLGPFTQQERPLSETLTEKAIVLKDSLVAGLKGEPAPSLEPNARFDLARAFILASVTTAFLAVVCGVISFLKREDLRYSASAAVIGGSALAFQFMIVAIGIAVLILVIAVLNR